MHTEAMTKIYATVKRVMPQGVNFSLPPDGIAVYVNIRRQKEERCEMGDGGER